MATAKDIASRFSIPGLPSLTDGVASLKLDGPVQAHRMMILWENMLCRIFPERLARVQVRVGKEETARNLATTAASGEFGPWVQNSSRELNEEAQLPLPAAVPSRVWQALYMQTSVQLEFEVHAAVWAPFCDPATGSLPEDADLEQHIISRIPPDVVAKPLPFHAVQFFQTVYGLSQPHTRWIGPKLEISCCEPAWVHRDGDGNAHSHMGPAAVWPDGSYVYCWRGMRAPTGWFPLPTREWLEERPTCPNPLPRGVAYVPPTPEEALQHPNLELRRVAMELVGWDAVVETLRPVVVDQDPDPAIGTLLRAEMPMPGGFGRSSTQTQQFLRVRCGTGRQFSLLVPPDVRTAREANAWTYGLEPDAYAPEVRT
jgi:hypothetical protein